MSEHHCVFFKAHNCSFVRNCYYWQISKNIFSFECKLLIFKSNLFTELLTHTLAWLVLVCNSYTFFLAFSRHIIVRFSYTFDLNLIKIPKLSYSLKQKPVDCVTVACTEDRQIFVTLFWLKTRLNKLFWTVPEYSMSLRSPGLLLLTAFNASPLSPGAPWGGKVASKRVEKEHYLLKPLCKMLRGHFFPPKWICFICFSLLCNSAIVLFVYTLFPPLYPFNAQSDLCLNEVITLFYMAGGC